MWRLLFISGSFLLLGCDKKECREVAVFSQTPVDLSIQRKEKELFECQSQDEVRLFLEKNELISQHFLHADQYPNLSILSKRIYGLITDVSLDTLYQESVSAFEKNQVDFIFSISRAFDQLITYYPHTKRPVIQTMVTGFYQDFAIIDSIAVIGLDYFIGSEATYTPLDIPRYIQKRYTYEYLPAALLNFYIQPYVKPGKESTLISEMIDWGKSYYFLSLLFPCMDEHLIIGYTAEESKIAYENQEVIWANFIQNKILFETNEITKRKFLGERPYLSEISEKCPGRIGGWLGWQIVKSYMEKSQVPIHSLLENTDHLSIFNASGFKPRNVKTN